MNFASSHNFLISSVLLEGGAVSGNDEYMTELLGSALGSAYPHYLIL